MAFPQENLESIFLFHTTEKISVVRREGNRDVNRTLQFYNLDAIISVGYRVNSIRATQFRQWATSVLRGLRGRFSRFNLITIGQENKTL